MSFLVANVPPIRVYIKKEYLYDHQKGHGELCEGHWVTVKSIRNRALYFETYIYETGALFDKLPISAFVWKKEYEGNMSLEELELWDGFDYHISIIRKDNNGSGKCKYLAPSKNWYHGDYLFTVDSAHEEPNIIDCGYSEYPEQHKSFNIIQLDNGHFAAQPNNRVIFYDKSLSPDDMKFPDYKVSTKIYRVENKGKWALGQDDNFFYEEKKQSGLIDALKVDVGMEKNE
tara:strand:+ start:654 stop:1343 length:690 start_codon:yes stop_codon:yes gene_type:complete